MLNIYKPNVNILMQSKSRHINNNNFNSLVMGEKINRSWLHRTFQNFLDGIRLQNATHADNELILAATCYDCQKTYEWWFI